MKRRQINLFIKEIILNIRNTVQITISRLSARDTTEELASVSNLLRTSDEINDSNELRVPRKVESHPIRFDARLRGSFQGVLVSAEGTPPSC